MVLFWGKYTTSKHQTNRPAQVNVQEFLAKQGGLIKRANHPI